jgi:hypothetical protein
MEVYKVTDNLKYLKMYLNEIVLFSQRNKDFSNFSYPVFLRKCPLFNENIIELVSYTKAS